MSDNMEIRFGETVRLDLGNTIPVPVRDYLLMVNKPQINGHELTGNLVIRVGDLENDVGYLTAETDPTVPAWAKQPNKPTYTAEEVGAMPDTTVIPVRISQLINDTGYYIKPSGGIPLSDLVPGIIPDFSSKLDASLKGARNGLAELDSNGMVPSHQLPSYVDDVKTYPSIAMFPTIGEDDKIYIDKSTNKQYRWSGDTEVGYVPIASSIALGETAQTAYRGDRGKAAYDHALAKGHAYESGLYKITVNDEGHVISAYPVNENDIRSLFEDGIASEDNPRFTGNIRCGSTPTVSGHNSFGGGAFADVSADNAFGYGVGLIVSGGSSFVFGEYNIENSGDDFVYSHWQPNTDYQAGSRVYDEYSDDSGRIIRKYYKAIRDTHTYDIWLNFEDWEQVTRAKYVEIVGNGTGSIDRSNARTLDWEGNEWLAGYLQARGLKLGEYAFPTGMNSIAMGMGATASSANTFAAGNGANASNDQAIAHGDGVTASGRNSFAQGQGTMVSGQNSMGIGSGNQVTGQDSAGVGAGNQVLDDYAFAFGVGLKCSHSRTFVFGSYNVDDSAFDYPEWIPGNDYYPGDRVKETVLNQNNEVDYIRYYECFVENSDDYISTSKWYSLYRDGKYIEIVGNGYGSTGSPKEKSNARALDWDGNEYLMGDIYVRCNPDGTGGVKLEAIAFATDAETRSIFESA